MDSYNGSENSIKLDNSLISSVNPQKNYYDNILYCILDVGEILLESGSEINRIEDTMLRISKAYGFKKFDVLVITSSIIVTAITEKGNIVSQTRRIISRTIDMNKIEKLNNLSRKICKNPFTLDEFKQSLENIRQIQPYPEAIIYFVYALTPAAFSIFFGGVWMDAIASAICGIFLKVLLDIGKKISMQNIVLTMLCSSLSGFLAYFLVFLKLGVNPDKIIIGIIMLLIPGVSLTSSLKDMFSGDLISGLLGITEALIRALAIAIGFAVVIFYFG